MSDILPQLPAGPTKAQARPILTAEIVVEVKKPDGPQGKTNPNGANQYYLDPRQRLCWEYYINPKSTTFGNAKQSAIRAGYVPDYADQITTAEWFLVKLRRLNMLGKAEKVLDEMLELPVNTLEWSGRGEDAEQVVITEPALVKVKQDTAKFVAERLGKNEGYSSRSEITGKDGEKLTVSDEKQAAVNAALLKFLKPK